VILVIDTATSQALVALGDAGGELRAAIDWEVGYRHGETLLITLQRLLADEGVALDDLTAIVVGTGPGAFTGLRVGLATAKALAHARALPIVGVSTAEALLAAAGGWSLVLLLPAGPNDRVVVRAGQAPRLLPGGEEPDIAGNERLVAVDLEGRAPAEALRAGRTARDGLAAALFRLGAARIRTGDVDDLARLVPEYVTLPRGVAAPTGEVEWSRDPR
jgi:tRNA threonylcarbamoyl adenosine modification protein YeaZ